MINVSWTQLKQIISSGGPTVQWFSDDNSYSVFDNSFTFQTTIPFSTPPSPDQLDFENNYQNVNGYNVAYSYSCAGAILVGSTPTDVVTLTGSSTKTVRLSKITISGLSQLPTNSSISLIARSSVDSGGTSSNPAIAPHDSNAPIPTGLVSFYTANPTLGTPTGTIRIASLEFPNVGGNAVPLLIWDFSTDPNHRPVLRGTSQQFCVNLAGAPIKAIHISMEWTEE